MRDWPPDPFEDDVPPDPGDAQATKPARRRPPEATGFDAVVGDASESWYEWSWSDTD